MADIGNGITFGTEVVATPGTYETVGTVQSITLPGVTRGTVDVTTLVDTARKHLGTIPDAGEVSVQIFYDETDTAQEALIASVEDAASRAGLNYQIAFPGGTTWDFTAIPTGAELGDATNDDAKMLTFTAKLTGGRGTITVV